jgi:hypothetical protein
MGVHYGPRFNIPSILEGLVLLLDAGNLSSYPGSGTTWTDLSGTGNSGTLNGTVGYDSANGGSLVFGGQPENTDYFRIDNIFNIAGVTNYSASLWIKFDPSSDGIDSRFFWHGVYGILIFKYSTGPGDNKINFFIRRSTTSSVAIASPSSTLFGVWTNIAVSYDGSIIKLYENGDLKNSLTYTGGLINAQSSTLWLGGLVGPGGPPFYTGCNMSQVSIYNRALSATEVKQNYNFAKSRYGLS